jgi:hypothetical protein
MDPSDKIKGLEITADPKACCAEIGRARQYSPLHPVPEPLMGSDIRPPSA